MSADEFSEEKSKSGCGTKLLIGLGAGFAVFVIVACAGGYFMFQKMKNAVTTEPAKVQQISESVVDLEIPAGLEPKFGMDFRVAGQGMAMAIYSDEKTGGSMFVMSISTPYDPATANVDDVKRNMENQQRQQQAQGQQQQKIIKLEEQEEIEKDVNGRPGKFLVGRGKDEAGVEHIQVLGIFESKSKELGMFNLVVPAEQMDMEAGRKLVESAK
jgi:hypothetical protein